MLFHRKTGAVVDLVFNWETAARFHVPLPVFAMSSEQDGVVPVAPVNVPVNVKVIVPFVPGAVPGVMRMGAR